GVVDEPREEGFCLNVVAHGGVHGAGQVLSRAEVLPELGEGARPRSFSARAKTSESPPREAEPQRVALQKSGFLDLDQLFGPGGALLELAGGRMVWSE